MTIDDLQHSHNLYSRQGSFLVGPGVTAEDMNIPDEETSRWLHGPMTRGDAVRLLSEAPFDSQSSVAGSGGGLGRRGGGGAGGKRKRQRS